jgi:DNA-binding SARP family transcriptional activator
MEFCLLGPLAVREGGRELPITGIKERSVLAILLLEEGRVVSADRLIDELWGDEPPPTARGSLQVRIAGLRQALGKPRIVSEGRGYRVQLAPGELDVTRFQRLLEQGGEVHLREALAIWQGPALADFLDQRWAQAAAGRLEELRLAALERRIDVDLEAGRHAQVVSELETQVREHPLREALHGQLMLALYRSGRQADALAAYQEARRTLVEQCGIEPSAALQRLQRGILGQDSALDEQPVPARRAVMAAALAGDRMGELATLAGTLARRPPRELIIARAIVRGADLGGAAEELRELQRTLETDGVIARTAAFSTDRPGQDLARIAAEQEVDLVVVDAPEGLLDDPMLADLLLTAPCDVAIALGSPARGPVLVPFSGADHDWSAIEIGAWLALARDDPLWLAGPQEGERDASRLLASASLALQRAVGVTAEPRLLEPGVDSLVAAASEASVVVVGLTDRWTEDGLGPARSALADAATPTLLVRRGLRPGGLAPPEGLTRFTWTVGPPTGAAFA